MSATFCRVCGGDVMGNDHECPTSRSALVARLQDAEVYLGIGQDRKNLRVIRGTIREAIAALAAPSVPEGDTRKARRCDHGFPLAEHETGCESLGHARRAAPAVGEADKTRGRHP